MIPRNLRGLSGPSKARPGMALDIAEQALRDIVAQCQTSRRPPMGETWEDGHDFAAWNAADVARRALRLIEAHR